MDMALIVYGGALSPFVRKVRVVLAEKGVEYTLENINPFAPPPEFVEISPLKRIPVLRDTDVPEPNTVPDSSVICDYLERKFPNPPLYPSDPFQRARALWFEEYADSLMAQCIGSGLFFERVVKKLIGKEPDESIPAKTIAEKLPPIFSYLENEIGSNQFLIGNAFSIADISVTTMLVNFLHAGETMDTSRWPNLAAYMARIHARLSFSNCIGQEQKFLSRFKAA
jgi:glutathione S-transferase